MSALGDKWRKRSIELDAALAPLMASTGVLPAAIQATKAAILSELYLAMAEMDEARQGATGVGVDIRATRNNLARLAAIKGASEGKWDEFDRIIDSLGTDFPGTAADRPTNA